MISFRCLKGTMGTIWVQDAYNSQAKQIVQEKGTQRFSIHNVDFLHTFPSLPPAYLVSGLCANSCLYPQHGHESLDLSINWAREMRCVGFVQGSLNIQRHKRTSLSLLPWVFALLSAYTTLLSFNFLDNQAVWDWNHFYMKAWKPLCTAITWDFWPRTMAISP